MGVGVGAGVGVGVGVGVDRRRTCGGQPVLLGARRRHDDGLAAQHGAVEHQRARRPLQLRHLHVRHALALARALVADEPYVDDLARLREGLEDVELARLGMELPHHHRQVVLGRKRRQVLSVIIVVVPLSLPFVRSLTRLARSRRWWWRWWWRRRRRWRRPRRRRRWRHHLHRRLLWCVRVTGHAAAERLACRSFGMLKKEPCAAVRRTQRSQ